MARSLAHLSRCTNSTPSSAQCHISHGRFGSLSFGRLRHGWCWGLRSKSGVVACLRCEANSRRWRTPAASPDRCAKAAATGDAAGGRRHGRPTPYPKNTTFVRRLDVRCPRQSSHRLRAMPLTDQDIQMTAATIQPTSSAYAYPLLIKRLLESGLSRAPQQEGFVR